MAWPDLELSVDALHLIIPTPKNVLTIRLNASPMPWTQYYLCPAKLRRWVFSTASMTRSTYIGMELMAYIVVKSRALPAPLAANLLLCEIALHAWQWAALPPATCESPRVVSYANWKWAIFIKQNCSDQSHSISVNLKSHLARQSSSVRDMCKFDRSLSLCLTNALANGAKKGYVTLVMWQACCTSCPSFQYNPLRSHVGRLLLDTVCTDEYLACAPGSRIYNGSTVTSYLQTVASPSPQKYSSVNYVGMFQLSEAVAWHKFAMIL